MVLYKFTEPLSLILCTTKNMCQLDINDKLDGELMVNY